MSSREAEKKMTDEELSQYFRNIRDEITQNIGALQAGSDTALLPILKEQYRWMLYVLKHLRNQYELLETIINEVRKTLPEVEDLSKKIRDFDKHRPILRWIEEYQKRAGAEQI